MSNNDSLYYKNGFSKSLIQNAKIIYPSDSVSLPSTIIMPIQDYTIKMSNFLNTSTYLDIQSNDNYFYYNRNICNTTEVDLLKMDDNVFSVFNTDDIEKEFSFSLANTSDIIGKLFFISNIGVQPDDTTSFEVTVNNNLKIINEGEGNSYNIKVKSLLPMISAFQHSNIDIPANSSHEIIPNWDNLENEDIVIYVDWLMDGSINDTLFIENQSTVIENDLTTENKVTIYPNPTKDLLNIKFDNSLISNQSDVKLILIDNIGRETELEITSFDSNEIQTNIGSFSSWIYYLKLVVKDKVAETYKVVVLD